MLEQMCNKCLIVKDISKFEWAPNRPNPRKTCTKCRTKDRVYTSEQKERIKKYKKSYWAKGRGKEVMEKCLYGITKSELGKQECVICGSTKRLCIDHCHTTLIVRGLLCSKCNTGLGMFDDDTDRMLKAIIYLKDYPHFELAKKG